MRYELRVAVDTPFHSGLDALLSYEHSEAVEQGAVVRVPLGSREVLGVVWSCHAAAECAEAVVAAFHAQKGESEVRVLRPIHAVLEELVLRPDWLALIGFAARYYQRALGEVALMALPSVLTDQSAAQWSSRLAKRHRPAKDKTRRQKSTSIPLVVEGMQADATSAIGLPHESHRPAAVNVDSNASSAQGHAEQQQKVLTTQQQAVLDALQAGQGTFLLHGVTGSGKTEVYLQAAKAILQADPAAQVLFMVPEINLTPQWQEQLQQRFSDLGDGAVAVLHSGLTPVQRLNHWLAVHHGQARLVLGTRLAVLASFAKLAMIVVDEEHDPSYKQQEGARYHARDLAVWRGKQWKIPVVLGSATPSLESWYNSRPSNGDDAGGSYKRLSMPERVGAGQLARLRMVDMRQQARDTVLSAPLMAAMRERMQRGEQCMVLLNRRGYAPVLQCGACGWKSDCPHCSAHQVVHRIDRSLRCHHCGWTTRVPRNCPQCGSIDLAPMGRGTEQLEELLQSQLSQEVLEDGRVPQVLRIDADSTRQKGALEAQLAQVHRGDIDVLVGTQMIAKGHDFRRIGLVAVVQPDGALYSSDFRAPERLFALLMQASGRAGRDADYMREMAAEPELWVQTYEPAHALYAALQRHDYAGFAANQLKEREEVGMPPFVYQALLRADARTQEVAQQFLRTVAALATEHAIAGYEWVTVYPPVPLTIQRVANAERAQMLLEASSRKALQAFLTALHPLLLQARTSSGKGLLRWLVDVDPLAI